MRSKMSSLLLALICVSFHLSAIERAYLNEILVSSFPNQSIADISVKELKGGLSATTLFKVEKDEKVYVLRVHHALNLNGQDERELFASVEAAKQGISPAVLYVSPDHRAILMEYIEGNTLRIEEAKQPSNIIKFASILRKAHQMCGHPVEGESRLSKADRCFNKVLKDNIGSEQDIVGAFELYKRYQQELSNYTYEPVNIHGDLNPRNIFIQQGSIKLIDWAETVAEDPFYDLSYFSLKHDYNQEEELVLLANYLLSEPSLTQLNRFALHKKIHQAFWSLTNLYLADAELKKHPEQKINVHTDLKEWGQYQKNYADCIELPAQYFYELSRLNYQLAKE